MLSSLLLFFYSFCFAAFQVPALTGPVVDEAGVISVKHQRILEPLLQAVQTRGKAQINILTLTSLHGESIEQASIQIVDQWKLGREKQDNGILFLIVPSERKVRIEVGRGLEGDLPDIYAKRILADTARPFFRQGLYGDGILAATLEIIKRVDPDFSAESVTQIPKGIAGTAKIPIGYIVVALFIFFFFIAPFMSHGRGRFRRSSWGHGNWGGGWSSGGSGGGWSGGGWSGGGGGFGGGGASDSW